MGFVLGLFFQLIVIYRNIKIGTKVASVRLQRAVPARWRV
jgi:hypothetical protein